jgi:ribonuclease P protein component
VDRGPGRFSRHNRLTGPRAFRRVFATGSRSADSNFLVLAAPNSLDHARLGLVISRRRVRLATARNRVKRVIRESFRRYQALLAGWDVVVQMQGSGARGDNATLQKSLAGHWKTITSCAKSSSP